MWPFPKKTEPLLNATQLQEAMDELGLVRLNGLEPTITDAMKKHLDPSNLYYESDDQGGHFGTEFNLSATVGRMKSLYLREPWVYSTASLIARTMSQVHFVVRDRATDEIDYDHPVAKLIESGNQVNDAMTMNWSGFVDLTLGGNYFRILSEDFKTVWHAPVEFCELRLSDEFKRGDMSADPIKELRITGGNGQSHTKAIVVPWRNVIHHKLPNPYNPYFGLSMFVAAARPILLDRHKNEFEMAFYLRGATNSGIIETSEDITKARMDRLMRTFEQSFTGRRNWWRTLFLPKNAKWVSNGMNMNEMQHLEGLRENRRTLLAVLGVPPSMVGIVEDVNRATSEIQSKAFWENTIMPLCNFIASGWNNSHLVKTIYKGAVKVEPDFSAITAIQGSIITKGEQTTAAKEALTINEIRTDIWGYPPLKQSDPRGQMFINQIRSLSLAADLMGSGGDIGPEDEDKPNPNDLAIMVEAGEEGHSHEAIVDKDGNGQTTSTSDGDEHTHSLTGSEQSDGTVLITVGEANGHTHPDISLDTDKSITARALKKAKADVTRDQDRIERIQSNKYKAAFDDYLAMLIDQAKYALLNDRDVLAHIETLQAERAVAYDVTVIPILQETMTRAFRMSIANSKWFSNVYKKADPTFTPTDEQAIEVIRERTEDGKRKTMRQRGLENFFGFDENATELILETIEEGLKQGKTFAEIAKTLENDFGENYRDQAFTITRTETLTAVSQGIVWEQEVLEEVFSEVEKQWFHIGDVGDNPLARAWHLDFEKEGKKPPKHSYISPETGNSLKYPRDPNGGARENINCFIGSMNVQSHLVSKAFKRFYTGPIVTIKLATGEEITGTPNHPMLTPKGWVSLGMLNKKHQLVKASIGDGPMMRDEDIGSIPTKFSEYFASVCNSGDIERVGGSAMDFHGDGLASDVEIVFKDSLLMMANVANGVKPVTDINLQSTQLRFSSLSSDSRLDKSGRRIFAGDGLMGSSYLVSSSLRRHTGPLKQFSLGSTSIPKAKPLEIFVKGDSANIKSLSQLIDAKGFVNMEAVDILDISITKDFRGHVYNLSTINEMYLVNGVITHNCRCSLVTTVAPGATSNAEAILENT